MNSDTSLSQEVERLVKIRMLFYIVDTNSLISAALGQTT